MKLKDFKTKALQNPKIKEEFDHYDLAFEIGQMILEARLYAGTTQSKLAEKLDTKQPSIARLENGKNLPSLSFLEKVAKALGTHLLAPRFAFLPTRREDAVNSQNKTEEFSMGRVTIESITVLQKVSGVATTTPTKQFNFAKV